MGNLRDYVIVQVWIPRDSDLYEFLLSQQQGKEKLGQTVKRLLYELKSILYYQQNSRRIKRSIKRELRERKRLRT